MVASLPPRKDRHLILSHHAGRWDPDGVPVVSSTGYAMAYGVALLVPWALTLGGGFTFVPSTAYIGSLVYLAVFGSVVAFGAYLTLLGRIGGERAAYATVLFPIVALLLSTAVEHFTWTLRDLIGVVLILVGNAVALTDPAALRRRPWRAPASSLSSQSE